MMLAELLVLIELIRECVVVVVVVTVFWSSCGKVSVVFFVVVIVGVSVLMLSKFFVEVVVVEAVAVLSYWVMYSSIRIFLVRDSVTCAVKPYKSKCIAWS